jgi:hypothetical protein
MDWIESNKDPNGTRSKTPCWVEESYADIGCESEKYLYTSPRVPIGLWIAEGSRR